MLTLMRLLREKLKPADLPRSAGFLLLFFLLLLFGCLGFFCFFFLVFFWGFFFLGGGGGGGGRKSRIKLASAEQGLHVAQCAHNFYICTTGT